MIATLRWAAPAALIAFALGCSQETPPSQKAAAPGKPSPKADATPAIAAANLVTLHVDGMV